MGLEKEGGVGESEEIGTLRYHRAWSEECKEENHGDSKEEMVG
jgi:hypothetical protein